MSKQTRASAQAWLFSLFISNTVWAAIYFYPMKTIRECFLKLIRHLTCSDSWETPNEKCPIRFLTLCPCLAWKFKSRKWYWQLSSSFSWMHLTPVLRSTRLALKPGQAACWENVFLFNVESMSHVLQSIKHIWVLKVCLIVHQATRCWAKEYVDLHVQIKTITPFLTIMTSPLLSRNHADWRSKSAALWNWPLAH